MKRLLILASAALLVLLIVAGPASAQSLGPDKTEVKAETLPRGTAVSKAGTSPTTGVAGVQIDRGPLAQTGIQVTTGALLAAILLAGGGLALVTARRRSVQL